MRKFPDSIQRLLDEFAKLPGVGPKTAERFVFFLLRRPKEEVDQFVAALSQIKTTVRRCSVCCNFSESNPCEYCSDKRRDHTIVCVVAESPDVLAIEKTGEYNGLYHVLGGVLRPMDGINPDVLRIDELSKRIAGNGVKEVIIATNPDIEGEATALYLTKVLRPLGITISRIAKGLPMGSDLEYADEVTLASALTGRRKISENENGSA